MRLAVILAACAIASAAFAEEWAMRSGDRPFTRSELAVFLLTHEVRFYDGGHSEYGPGSSYAYVYESGARAEGRYRIEQDGSVCVDFGNGLSRCDLYVRNGTRVLLIDQKGDRFPLR